ncbi:heme exporter protein CcmD [Hirschia litorea]|uniref:Heme exporter protein D n=1 Tax=Hirschia litorea TaxID=1199156 RepID=A0ABW2IMS4_9PROT
MDKYAPFVWASYGVAFGLLAVLTVFIVLRLKRAKTRHEKLVAESSE